MEPIFSNEDGSISEVKQTSSGVGAAIPAAAHIPANLACELTGHVRIAGDEASPENLVLSEIRNGDTALFRYLDFAGESTLRIRMKTDSPCRVELWVDGLYHAEAAVAPSETYGDTEASMPPLRGRHTVALRFYPKDAAAILAAEAIRFN
jgi:hypothetical protein